MSAPDATGSDASPGTPVRDAATLILVRDKSSDPRILVGQRGARAAFMPNKFVFPGGAVDTADGMGDFLDDLNPACRARLSEGVTPALARGLVTAALRELWEETGLLITEEAGARPQTALPPPFDSIAPPGRRPSARGLRFVFRAITPPGRPRRFDARFFLADAGHLDGDADDFSAASDELSNLHWVRLAEARALDLPFITEVVLAEVARLLSHDSPPDDVPFFANNDEESLFHRLKGRAPRSS